MDTFLAMLIGIWFWIAFFSSPYFWFKKTDRTQAPIARRGLALVFGLAWPYFVYRYFAGRRGVEEAERQRREAEDRILRSDGGLPAHQTPASNGPTSKIQNPFDN
jgi:hypothetical protein